MQLEGSILTQQFSRFDVADRAVCGFDSAASADGAWHELNVLACNLATANPNARLIGISVAFFSQVVPALLLCRQIRERLPRAKTILGGPQIAMWQEQLRQLRATRLYVDYMCTGQGEPTLVALAHLMCAQDSNVKQELYSELASVPNLLYMSDRGFVASTAKRQVPLDQLPPPDLSLLASSRYFNNEIQIPITTCVGCYWGRCSFCSYGNRYLRDKAYDQLSPARLAELCDYQLRRHPTQRINFVDENTNLRLVLSAARLLQQRGVTFNFSTRNRLEPSLLDIDFCRALSDAGCVLMSVGYETNSQRLLDALDKGLDARTFQRVLENLDAVGIEVRLSVIVGALDETADERQASLAFLKDNEALVGIDSFQFLAVEPGSFLHERLDLRQDLSIETIELTLNSALSYGSGRAGVRSKFDLGQRRDLLVEEVAEFQRTLKPAKNDEFPSAPLVPLEGRQTEEFGDLTSVALHPWVRLERVGGAGSKDSRLVLFDLLAQRLYQLPASLLRLQCKSRDGVTSLSLVSDENGGQVLRQLIESGLGTRLVSRPNLGRSNGAL